MKRPETEYLNEYNPDHFWTQRRSMPPWHPPTPAVDVDIAVAIVIALFAIAAAFGVYFTEGGL